MTHLDDAALDELARLAGEATPGPWTARTDLDSSGEFDIELSRHGGTIFGLRGWRRDIDAAVQLIGDATYIAAANPATVAALVAEVQRWRPLIEACAILTDHLDRMDWPHPHSQYVHAVGDAYRAALDGGQ